MLTRTGHARTRTRINTTGSSFSYPNIAGIVSVPSPWGGKRGALSPCSTHNTGRVMFSRPRCPPLMCALSVAAAWRTLLMTIARTSHAYHTHSLTAYWVLVMGRLGDLDAIRVDIFDFQQARTGFRVHGSSFKSLLTSNGIYY